MSHPIKRAKERYGVDLTEADIAGMVAKIEAGKACFVRNEDRDRSSPVQQYVVTWEAKAYRVVYDTKAKIIYTFLPRLWGAIPDRVLRRSA